MNCVGSSLYMPLYTLDPELSAAVRKTQIATIIKRHRAPVKLRAHSDFFFVSNTFSHYSLLVNYFRDFSIDLHLSTRTSHHSKLPQIEKRVIKMYRYCHTKLLRDLTG